MNFEIFSTFARMVDALPSKAVLNALDVHCRMLEDDLAFNREDAIDDAFSIFSFRMFVRAAKMGKRMRSTVILPEQHLAFYRKILARLVQANELEPIVVDEFNRIFLLRSEIPSGADIDSSLWRFETA